MPTENIITKGGDPMKKTVKRIFALFMSLLLLPSAFAGVTSFTAAAEDAAEEVCEACGETAEEACEACEDAAEEACEACEDAVEEAAGAPEETAEA